MMKDKVDSRSRRRVVRVVFRRSTPATLGRSNLMKSSLCCRALEVMKPTIKGSCLSIGGLK